MEILIIILFGGYVAYKIGTQELTNPESAVFSFVVLAIGLFLALCFAVAGDWENVFIILLTLLISAMITIWIGVWCGSIRAPQSGEKKNDDTHYIGKHQAK